MKKKDADNISKQWKGKIMAIRPVAPHSSKVEVLIQHVYMHKELALSKNQTLGHKPNSKFICKCNDMVFENGVRILSVGVLSVGAHTIFGFCFVGSYISVYIQRMAIH